jgi:hypothetical protein
VQVCEATHTQLQLPASAQTPYFRLFASIAYAVPLLQFANMAEGVTSFDIAFAPVKNAPNVCFTYSSVPAGANNFRLLQILPSLINMAAIHRNLFNGSIDEQIFIAGSYVWGPLTPTRPIILNRKALTKTRLVYAVTVFQIVQGFGLAQDL